MSVSYTKDLIDLYTTNHETIHKQIAGITQVESLLQPPFQGNCLNWVIGHIAVNRNQALQFLGLPGVVSQDEIKHYGHGSEPITGPANALQLDFMVNQLDVSLTQIVEKLKSFTPADLEKEVQNWRGPIALSSALSFNVWHEAYHTGQLELLRQLAGKNDKVI